MIIQKNLNTEQLRLFVQENYNLQNKTALVIIDEVNGFCTPGCGPLAPPVQDSTIENMVKNTVRLAKLFIEKNMPIIVFLDSHSERPEPPYPPHCIEGTGHDELVDELKFIYEYSNAIFIKKDCINGFVGAIDVSTNQNKLVNFVNQNGVENLLFVGICTDICVMDIVLTTLSARNHELMPTLKEILVDTDSVSTYDLPRDVTLQLGLPEQLAHPREITHYMGLYFMASRGALLVSNVN